jgi:glycogen synthase
VKIALLSFEYPPETGYGGIGTYTWYQARALVKLGHEVHVLAGANESTPLRETEHDGVKVFRYRSSGFLMRSFQRLQKFRMWWTKNRLENATSMSQAFRELNRVHRYDIVEMPECGAEGLFINQRTKVPTVIKLHSPAQLIMPFYDVRPADIKFCSFLEKRGIINATTLTACSKFLAKEVQIKLNVKDNIQVIPNGIDLNLFDQEQKQDILKKFEIPVDRPVILFNGRMEKRKGIHLCKEIVTSILERYEVSFLLAGQDLFHQMRDVLIPYWESRDFRGSFHYLGTLDQSSVRSLLHQTNIFLFPSLWENCPYACLEAMAAGCTIVSTDQGGMPEMIRNNENGLLARNGDIASFVSCLERLIEDQAFRKRLGTQARETIAKYYTDTRIAQSSFEFYRGFIKLN